MVVPAALNCTLGEHFYKNDYPNDVKLSKLIQLGLKMILDGKLWYFMKLQYSKGIYHYLRPWSGVRLKFITTVVPNVPNVFVFLKYLWYDCNLFDQI